MELSFASENSAEASLLAKELEQALRWQGLPAGAMSLKPSSPEHMDVGSVLWVSMEMVNQILGPVGSIATVAACVHQIMTKYHKDAVIDTEGSKVKISASKASAASVEAALITSPGP
jgi:hypothetical protein